MKKIIVHTDASNVVNSGKCKMSAVIEHEGVKNIRIKYCEGRINHAELIIVLDVLRYIEKNYNDNKYSIYLYSDHLPNVKFLNRVLNYRGSDLEKINKILNRKKLTWEDIGVINRLNKKNNLNITWISRKENFEADKLSKDK